MAIQQAWLDIWICDIFVLFPWAIITESFALVHLHIRKRVSIFIFLSSQSFNIRNALCFSNNFGLYKTLK